MLRIDFKENLNDLPLNGCTMKLYARCNLMPKPLPTLMIEIILLPITILGLMIFAIGFYSKLGGTNISQTAYDPMFARWFLHVQGKREDKAAEQIWD